MVVITQVVWAVASDLAYQDRLSRSELELKETQLLLRMLILN